MVEYIRSGWVKLWRKSLFIWFSVYLWYNVIDVIYISMAKLTFELWKNDTCICIHMMVLNAWHKYRDQRKSICARPSPWNKHTRVELAQLSAIIQRIYERWRGGLGGASPKEASRMKRSQIKWKLLLFNESVFIFFYGQFTFLFSLIKEPCYLFSCKLRNVFLF